MLEIDDCGELQGPVEQAKTFQRCFELAPPVPVGV